VKIAIRSIMKDSTNRFALRKGATLCVGQCLPDNAESIECKIESITFLADGTVMIYLDDLVSAERPKITARKR